MAKNSGKVFEDEFAKSVDQSLVYYQRMRDSASSFAKSSIIKFTPNNPYDNFCFYRHTLFPLELKTTKNGYFTIQREKSEKTKMIKYHQIEGLTKANQYDGIYAGFIFHFSDEENRENDKTYWVSIENFNIFLSNTEKKSINRKDIERLCPIEVNKQLKKVHYKFEVTEMLDKILSVISSESEE